MLFIEQLSFYYKLINATIVKRLTRYSSVLHYLELS